jgi:hypothetical protein
MCAASSKLAGSPKKIVFGGKTETPSCCANKTSNWAGEPPVKRIPWPLSVERSAGIVKLKFPLASK